MNRLPYRVDPLLRNRSITHDYIIPWFVMAAIIFMGIYIGSWLVRGAPISPQRLEQE